jgi:hypothetical protein
LNLISLTSLYPFKIVAFVGTVSSRLDVTRRHHSGGHTQSWQHPAHQNDVRHKKANEQKPVEHDFNLLMDQ